MTATIHVSLPYTCDADDLADFFAERGLTAAVAGGDDQCELDVGYPEARLHFDVENALAAWLEDSERPLIPIATGPDDYVLRPPGD